MLSRLATKVDLWMDPVAVLGSDILLAPPPFSANKKYFAMAERTWGSHTHDAVSLTGNSHLSNIVSPSLDGGAFSKLWTFLNLGVNSSWVAIPRILVKVIAVDEADFPLMCPYLSDVPWFKPMLS
ncbi:hypothetical protein SARC_13843 [Sphaeroforma arctica JP610]|uniref:Uncharacterized protein n=1 Tax=Sphaeroforma arctica JP610 TaxID=667725 RepID=A0A0L0FC07_9EUKA|nr:hypothetical protein SARC_13843 [Sphaeroforma arctica JP610]KNC73598.1 hypothetical protein SARC_13843 [Sphaeroforma arctica JP610]|eukprot:XP_014147500.1 hypothetical protein SARC_13843 [Sphaeroforma arctica JP610]